MCLHDEPVCQVRWTGTHCSLLLRDHSFLYTAQCQAALALLLYWLCQRAASPADHDLGLRASAAVRLASLGSTAPRTRECCSYVLA